MSATIKIELSEPVTGDLIHRFRNFGEDVYRALRERCSVSIEEIGRATDCFHVRDVRRRDLGAVIQIIEWELHRHGLQDSGRIVREDRERSS